MEIEGRNHGVTIAKNHGIRKRHAGKSTASPRILRRRKGSDGKAFQTMSEDSQGPKINSEMPNFTKEQLGHLYKLFQSPQFSNPMF